MRLLAARLRDSWPRRPIALLAPTRNLALTSQQLLCGREEKGSTTAHLKFLDVGKLPGTNLFYVQNFLSRNAKIEAETQNLGKFRGSNEILSTLSKICRCLLELCQKCATVCRKIAIFCPTCFFNL